ncbi:MAG TPA: hypothetical protein ACFYEK_01185 [Candidatus Wunengus sp. YC60]|uniref:hypothetical protein n=1 Tax=Candidatus Wunengus sp. YC60 TaxID=3367697 RepID=UPI004024E1E8
MIKVYFETERPKYAEQVAIFDDEETYHACLPALEKLAKKHNFDLVTESVETGDIGELKETPEKKTHYFLFGESVCRAYHEKEFTEVIEMVNDGIEFAVHKFVEGEHPDHILEAASGWMDYATIDENEYNQLKELED